MANTEYDGLLPRNPGLIEYPHTISAPPFRPEPVIDWKQQILQPNIYFQEKNIIKIFDKIKKSSEKLELIKESLKQGINLDKLLKLEIQSNNEYINDLRNGLETYVIECIMMNTQLPHIPSRNTSYHVYRNSDEYIISIISPKEWSRLPYDKYIISFQYDNEGMISTYHPNLF